MNREHSYENRDLSRRRFVRRSVATASMPFLATALGIGEERQADTAQPAAKDKTRVLLTFGGHDFQRKEFFDIFDAMPDVEYTKAELPASAHLLKPGLEKDYDVIVMYDMVMGITSEEQQALVELLDKGIGLVSLHHNLCAHRNWDEWRKVIGGKWIFEDCEIDGAKYSPGDYEHGVDIKIVVADPKHPITQGIKDFMIHDEGYWDFYTADDNHLLLKTDHVKDHPGIAWVCKYGGSPVCYIMLGHGPEAYAHPSYRRLIHQAIGWAAGEGANSR